MQTAVNNEINVIEGITFEVSQSPIITLKASLINARYKAGYKILFYYRFETLQALQRYQCKYLESVRAKNQETAQRKALINALKQNHTIKVDDIFYESWGYDQTNINFYQVVEINKTMLTLRPILQERTETGFMSGFTLPLKDQFTNEQAFKKVLSYSKWDKEPKPYIKGKSSGWAELYEPNKRIYCSWYA